MTVPRAPSATDDVLLRGLRRWRATLGGSALAIGALVTGLFAFQTIAERQSTQSGIVLRQATAAQRAAWEAEAAVRALLRRDDPFAAARVVAEDDSLRTTRATVRVMVTDQPQQQARVDAITVAWAQWHETFAAPALADRTLTRALALAGTVAFDRVSREFEAFIAEASTLRATSRARQAWARRFAYVLILLALAAAGVAASRLTRALETEAHHALEHQQRIEEQSVELEAQTTALEEQAAQLKGQSAALQERVAERDETLRRLRQTSTFLDSALESAPIGIGFYDRGLRFQRINAALARINGAPPEAHLGRRIEDMIPELAPILRPILERILASGQAETDVVVEGVTPAAPEPRRGLATCYPIRRPGEAPIGVGCMVLDVTEQHRVEQQLRQAQKLEAVGRLAGGIAHDFNNVLTVIQSYAEVLAFELDERDVSREEVDAIRTAADRAAALARQLLAFARRDVIIPRSLDVREVIHGMDLILRRMITTNITLRLDLATEPLVVRVDAGQLEQVLMNLTINAVDAMPDGGPLHIAARAEGGEGGEGGEAGAAARVIIEVTDTGTGMTDEVKERLLEPFFTTKPAGRGTGLGLATTYAIVIEAGGRIAVESVAGNGRRFTITLPMADAVSAADPKRLSPASGVERHHGTELILLAEDEPAIRTALSRILHANGYRVLEAENGGEALRLAAAEPGPIDLLLTDVMMPGIGGKELVQRVLEMRPGTRVILMSGYTDDADLRAELGTSRFLFLQKPFAARQMVAAVREALDAP